jgi:hypothetical protein
MKPSLGKLSKIIVKTLKHNKTIIIHHEAYNKYLVMICRKMAMKCGKVRKYDLEVVKKYDGNEGIFKAQQFYFINMMESTFCRSELPFGYYGELKLASKRHLGTLAPFGPRVSN